MSVSASAQSFSEMFGNDAKGRIEYGVRAGLNISGIGGHDAFKTKLGYRTMAGFHVGGIVGIPVTNGFYVQPGLYFSSKGARTVYQENDRDYEYSEKESMFPVYLEIPVLASFRTDISDNLKLNVDAGPYFAAGLGGKYSIRTEENDAGDIYTENKTADFFGKSDMDTERFGAGRFDFGLSFGAGLTILEHYHIGIKYDLGLLNMAIIDKFAYQEGYRMHNGTFAITLGYNF